MNRPSFDVLSGSWIPVIRLDGSRDELGILPCLEQAHELREIRDPAPIIEFGLYRLLGALVLDVFIFNKQRPEDHLDLKELIKVGHFDKVLIEKYIEHCGDVFDLFHPERPFLQITMQGKKTKPLAGLYPVAPSGTNATHWHHEDEGSMSVSFQEAARLLTTIAPFMLAVGRGNSPSINGAPAIYALPVGENLFETIMFNIPLRTQDSGEGKIAWLSNRRPGTERTQATTVEALTWRPRCIQLVPRNSKQEGESVREMKFESGDKTRLMWRDANLAYKYGKDNPVPVRMRENRPLWRDAGPLLLLNENEHGRDDRKVAFRRPDVVEQAFNLIDTRDKAKIQVYGMRTDMNAKVFEWAKASWSVPANLGRSTRLGSLVQHELTRAEDAAYGMRNCIKALYPREGAGNKEALGTIAGRCERTYWQRLESSFHPLMNAFAALDPNAPDDPNFIATTAKDWRETIQHLAIEQFEFAAKDMDTNGDALERQVDARTWLNNTLREALS